MQTTDIKSRVLKTELSQYGKVIFCKKENGMFHVRITEGFSVNAMKTFECMKKITEAVGDEFSIIHKCHTDTDLFELVLKPKL